MEENLKKMKQEESDIDPHVPERYFDSVSDVYGFVYENICGGGYDEANQAMDGILEQGLTIESGIIGLLQTCFDIETNGLKETIRNFPEVEIQPYLVKAIADDIEKENISYYEGDETCCEGVVTYKDKDYNFVIYQEDETPELQVIAQQILIDNKIEIQREKGEPYQDTIKDIVEKLVNFDGMQVICPTSSTGYIGYEPTYCVRLKDYQEPFSIESSFVVTSTRELAEKLCMENPEAARKVFEQYNEILDKIPMPAVHKAFCEKLTEVVRAKDSYDKEL